jgi:hypothetical protein
VPNRASGAAAQIIRPNVGVRVNVPGLPQGLGLGTREPCSLKCALNRLLSWASPQFKRQKVWDCLEEVDMDVLGRAGKLNIIRRAVLDDTDD